ncbi:MAG: hypothetical protein ABIH23_25695 [bacterium]
MKGKRPILCMLFFVLCLLSIVLVLIPLTRWGTDYLSASETILSFNDAVCVNAVREGIYHTIRAVGGEGRVAILAHPPSRLEWTVQVREGQQRFQVDLALDEGAWDQDGSDGVTFRAWIIQGGSAQRLFEKHVDPRHEETDREWVSVETPFESNGELFILALETGSGPEENADFDWALWAEPQILEGAKPLNVMPVIVGCALFLVSLWLCRYLLRTDPAGVRIHWVERCEQWAMIRCVVFVVIAICLLTAALVTEGFFQRFPRVFPYSANQYLPDNGLRYFREGTQREVYDREIGYMRRPNMSWCWRHQSDLVESDLVSAAYVESNPDVIRFETDADGFRVQKTGPGIEDISIVALGDSYTEAPEVQWNETWVSILAHEAGVPVRNLGVSEQSGPRLPLYSGYSPQQSLIVLRKAIGQATNPGSLKVVLFPLFDTTAILNADLFSLYQESHMSWPEFLVKSRRLDLRSVIVRRLSFSFAWAALKHTSGLLSSYVWRPLASVRHKERFLFNPVRGAIEGSPVHMAFYDEYLYRSTFPRARWVQCKGWGLTCETLRTARDICNEAGVHLLVLFFPSKESIYLPLLNYDPQEFDRYVARIAKDPPADGHTWHENFQTNRGVVNDLVRDFCEENGMVFLDLTPELNKAASKGDLVYFPADTHWNPYGHCIVGETIAGAITERNLLNEG